MGCRIDETACTSTHCVDSSLRIRFAFYFIVFHDPTPPAKRSPFSSSVSRRRASGRTRKFGQNFLIDLNLLDVLLDAAAITRDDVVLEVGTGTGSLTARLAQQAAAVVTVEIDPPLFQLAGEELHRFDNVVMLQVDALQNKNRLNPAVLEAVAAQLAAAPGRRFKLVANLPYNIATPILSNLLGRGNAAADHDRHDPEGAGRADHRPAGQQGLRCAEHLDPGAVPGGDPSHLAAGRVLAAAEGLVGLPPDHRSTNRCGGGFPTGQFFHDFVRAMFCHRRKFLRSELLSVVKGRLGKPEVDALLARLNLDGTARAESLDVERMLALCEAVRTAPVAEQSRVPLFTPTTSAATRC